MGKDDLRGSSRMSDAAAASALTGDEAMRVEDVMRLLNLSRNTVYKLAREGEIPSIRVGRQLRFRRQDIILRLQGNSGPVSAQAPATASVPESPSAFQPQQQGLSASAAASSPEAGSAPQTLAGTMQLRVGSLPDPADVLDALPVWARGSLIIGGQDMAADVLANYVSGLGVKILRSHTNAFVSLARMYLGTCDAVVLDLWSEEDQRYNTPYVRRMLPGMSVVVLRLYQRRVGFTVAAKNPLGIKRWSDLLNKGVVLSNRERGAGSRVLLDEKLRYLEADATSIVGYGREVESELAQGLLVSNGIANVAVTGEKVWRQVRGLDFLPMQNETVDIVVAKTHRTTQLIKAVRSLLRTGAFRSEFDPTVTDVGMMGEVVYET